MGLGLAWLPLLSRGLPVSTTVFAGTDHC
ncbi:MAG: hypothetical protein J07HQW2_00593, partial [Haloquadratum walsbyi J07HQW2]